MLELAAILTRQASVGKGRKDLFRLAAGFLEFANLYNNTRADKLIQ